MLASFTVFRKVSASGRRADRGASRGRPSACSAIVRAGEQEAQRGTPGQKRNASRSAPRMANICIGPQHAAGFVTVEGDVRLETPGIEADGGIVGQGVAASEVEVDEARDLAFEEEDVIGEEIGVNDAGLKDGRGPD